MVLTRTADQQPPVAGGYRDGSGTPGAELVGAAGFAQLAVLLYDAAGVAETADLVPEYALRATGRDCAGVVLVRPGKGLQAAGVTQGGWSRLTGCSCSTARGRAYRVRREHHSLQKRHVEAAQEAAHQARAQVSVRKEINL